MLKIKEDHRINWEEMFDHPLLQDGVQFVNEGQDEQIEDLTQINF